MTLVGRNKLIKAQILRFSMNTLKMHHSNMRKYSRYISGDILPIDTGTLHSFLLEEAENGRSFISIESCLNSLRFISNFLGYEIIENAALKNLFYFSKNFVRKNLFLRELVFKRDTFLTLKIQFVKSVETKNFLSNKGDHMCYWFFATALLQGLIVQDISN